MFDDEAVDLLQEPFVSGVPEMIDELVAGISNARAGIRLLFSESPFPDYQRKLNAPTASCADSDLWLHRIHGVRPMV